MAIDSPKIVGFLRLRTTVPRERRVDYDIFANATFDVGRRDVEEDLQIQAPAVSNHHLRFRCVSFDEDGEIRVAPMVYVQVLSKNTVWLSPAQQSPSTPLCNGDPDLLLNDGDTLYLTSTISMQFVSEDSCAVKKPGMTTTQKRELRYFEGTYQVTDRRLGAGGQADVFVAIEKQTQRQVACKVVPVPFVSASDLESLRSDPTITEQERIVERQRLEAGVLKSQRKLCREFEILKNLRHPNIIKLHKVFHTSRNVYIFEDLVAGGDLLSYLEKEGRIAEPQTAVIVRQILKAVDYLHDNRVVHRDIKPENVLMTSWRDGARVVLTDFGQSRMLGESDAVVRNKAVLRMQSVVGTVGYTAPEIFQQAFLGKDGQGYSKAVDIWSVGCITASLLTGRILFEENELHEERTKGSIPDPSKAFASRDFSRKMMDASVRWRGVGRKAKSFIRDCVAEDEVQRLTAKQALAHDWFANRHYALELEAAYKRAIQDWEPRLPGQDIVEYVDTSNPADETGLHNDATSRYFNIQPANNPKNHNKSMFYTDKCQNHHATSADINSSLYVYSEGPETPGMVEQDVDEEGGVSQASTIVPIVTQHRVDSGI